MKTLLTPSTAPRRAVVTFSEKLGVAYERVLMPVAASGASVLRDRLTGRQYGVQRVPSMPIDDGRSETVDLVVVDLAPGQRLELSPASGADAAAIAEIAAITVERAEDHLVIRNGRLAVRVPADGPADPPFAGPIEAMQLDGGPWWGGMRLHDAPGRGLVETRIESIGPACVQWRTRYRWGARGGCTWRVRWAAGSDTLIIVDEGHANSAAGVEWIPFEGEAVRGWVRGGGEKQDAMQPLEWRRLDGARRQAGRRRLHQLGHIGYFHQWNLGWVGFAASDGRFAGIFSGWGGRWENRGAMAMPILEDDRLGHLVRMPVRRGVRILGLVIGTRAEADLEAEGRPHLLNRRKMQWSDLAVAKVSRWNLDPPIEVPRPHLLAPEDLAGWPQRLASMPEVRRALRQRCAALPVDHPLHFPAALAEADEPAMRQAVGPLLDWARSIYEDLAGGGYERVNIFRGRVAKRHAYVLDALWAKGLIDEADYRRVRSALLALAYAFSDPDFCRYGDYWPDKGRGNAAMVRALQQTMGNCPTPPNFASEFFSTVAVAAELFPSHPRAALWRQWGMRQLDRFLRAFFRSDGTYCESINYHLHAINELICQIYPLWHKGVRDYFADGRIKGSFVHFCAMQMPPLRLPRGRADGRPMRSLSLADPATPRAVLPGDGNSGSHGRPQEHKGELALGASIYRASDPELSANLMHAWRAAGRLVLDHEHPLLSLVRFDSNLPALPMPWQSTWRKGLGVISKSTSPDGLPLWCLIRAGRATNHMDFDQGNLHLVMGDRVLLGDHGYHTHCSRGKPIHAAATWLHNTITYAADRELSSGYTGLERAPEPLRVHLDERFDWVVHRIVNTNYRHLGRLQYRDLLPAPTTIHLRHVLVVKGEYLVVWDVLPEAHEPPTFWLHPPEPVERIGPGAFRSGRAGEPHLAVRFVLPESLSVVENRRVGPLWSLGVRGPDAQGFLAVLVPQVGDRGVEAEFDGESILRVRGRGIRDTIHLPPPGSPRILPRIVRDEVS